MFSDEGLDWMIVPAYPGGGEQHVLVTGGGRLFVRGVPRSLYHGGWHTFPAAVYEVTWTSVGERKGQKLFDIEGNAQMGSNFRQLFTDSAGARIGYLNYENGRLLLTVRETRPGAPARQVDLTSTALDCMVTRIGFLPVGREIFFTLDTGDDDATSRASYRKVGSYRLNLDGAVPPKAVRMSGSAANLLAPLRGERELYAGRVPEAVVYTTEAGGQGRRREYKTASQGVTGHFRVATGGAWVAFVEEQRGPGPEFQITHVIRWMDMASGKERWLEAASTKPLVLPWVNLIGWWVAGTSDDTPAR